MYDLRLAGLGWAVICFALAWVQVRMYLDEDGLTKVLCGVVAIFCVAFGIWHTVHIFSPDWMVW